MSTGLSSYRAKCAITNSGTGMLPSVPECHIPLGYGTGTAAQIQTPTTVAMNICLAPHEAIEPHPEWHLNHGPWSCLVRTPGLSNNFAGQFGWNTWPACRRKEIKLIKK